MNKIRVATRGSSLALAQTQLVINCLKQLNKKLLFETVVVKTTGDKIQKSVGQSLNLGKGLFTKEIENALIRNEADLAVHSLKDLPTEIPEQLKLVAVLKREDPRDVIIYCDESTAKDLNDSYISKNGWSPGMKLKRGFSRNTSLKDLTGAITIGTCSTRRAAQLLSINPHFKILQLRGNVGTRFKKLLTEIDLDAIILASAGLRRLGIKILSDSTLWIDTSKVQNPELSNLKLNGLCGIYVDEKDMIPAVGQGAIAIEIRKDDKELEELCQKINHKSTYLSVISERSFLRTMGGGCQTPVAAHAKVIGHKLVINAISYRTRPPRSVTITGSINDAEALGQKAALAILEKEK